MRILERIEGRATMLAAKTERFELLRQQYLTYLKRVFANTKSGQESVRPSPMPEEISTISEEKTDDLYTNPIIRKAMYGSKYDDIKQNSNLYEHPVIKNALSVNKDVGKLSPKLDVVKQYLRSFSPPISGGEVLKASRSSEKISSFRNKDFLDSNDVSYTDEYPYYSKTKAGNIADQIISSINSKPKLTSPLHERDLKKSLLDNEDRFRTRVAPIEIKVENASENSDFLEDEHSHTPKGYDAKSKEEIKVGEVKFKDDQKHDIMPEIPKMLEQNEANAEIKETLIEKNKDMNHDEKETLEEFIQEENIQNNLPKTDVPGDDSLLHVDTVELLNDEISNDLTLEKELEENMTHDINFVEDFEGQDYIRDDEHYEKKLDNIDNVSQENYIENLHEEYDVNNPLDDNAKPLEENIQFGFDNGGNENGDQANIHHPYQENESSIPMESKPSTTDKQAIESTLEKGRSSVECDNENPNVLQKDQAINENAQINNAQHQQDALQYDQNKESTLQYDENGQPIQYTDADQNNRQREYNENIQNNPQYENNVESTLQYDQNNQPVLQYDGNGQPIQYAEDDQHIMSYDQMQYDQSGHYDEHGQPIMQYDENGQPIAAYNESMLQYDENGQPLHMQYDENGQPIMQYDQNGQPIMRYDENGQPLYGHYDETNQPHVQYDENGQPIIQYDENGQPIYQYQQSEGYYAEGQIYGDEKQNYEQPANNVEDVTATKEAVGSNQQKPVDPSKQEVAQNSSGKEKRGNVMEMLDTDTESARQDTNKVSNDSDFDFSNSK